MPGGRPGGDGPLANRQRVVGHHRLLGHFVDAAQAMTLGAGSLRACWSRRLRRRRCGWPARIGAGTRIEHPQQIRERGDAADRRAGGRRAALLLQGHGRRQAVDFVDFGHAHLMEQPPGIGSDRFEIAPLRLGIERAKGQRRFARAGNAGENHQGIAGNIEIDVLEIVLARPADAHEPGEAVLFGLVRFELVGFFHGTAFFTAQRAGGRRGKDPWADFGGVSRCWQHKRIFANGNTPAGDFASRRGSPWPRQRMLGKLFDARRRGIR